MIGQWKTSEFVTDEDQIEELKEVHEKLMEIVTGRRSNIALEALSIALASIIFVIFDKRSEAYQTVDLIAENIREGMEQMAEDANKHTVQ